MSSTAPNKLFGLLDCNNFYVSCERLFNPSYRKRPVVVLSNNDGCIIARSNEAKALGVPMGAALFEWRDFFHRHGVIYCSANFSLYGDLSHRVMQILYGFDADIEIYSIDEAFLTLATPRPIDFCRAVREKMLQWTGIPVSIGVGRTKTLAKAANKKAKKDPTHQGVFGLLTEVEEEALLEQFLPEDLWGIGSRSALHLKREGIYTSLALKRADDALIRSLLSVHGLRTVWELRGIPCFSLDENPPPKKSILTSRTFKEAVRDKEILASLIAAYAARGGEKLREEGLYAGCLTVFITTSRHKEESFYSNTVSCSLSQPTDYTPTLISSAKRGLAAIFRSGYAYKRGGVLLSDLTSPEAVQQDFFSPYRFHGKEKTIMELVDGVSSRYGHDGLFFAAEGALSSPHARKRCSPAYTTRWDEILTIQI